MALRGGGVRALGMCIAGALAATGLALVYAAVVTTGQSLPSGSKASPLSLTVFSSSSLPPEVQAQEAASAPLLFDRDTNTQHAAFAESQVQATLDAVQEVRAIKVFGAAPYLLTVKADAGGSFQNIAGLENLNLTLLAAGWHTFQSTAPVSTSKLLFALTPATGGSASGLRELEVWTAAVPVSSADGAGLLQKLLGPNPPGHAKLYTALNPTANPTVGVVTPNDSGGDLADNTFTFTLDRDPARFVRAYLTYELFGQSSFISPRRNINKQLVVNSVAGGGLILPAATWSSQVERINPAWLIQGANTVEFSVLSSSFKEAGFTVRNVRVVAELDNGANAVETIAVNQHDVGSNPVGALYDGNLETGWRPYPTDQPIDALAPAVEFELRRPTEMSGVSVYLAGTLAGEVKLSVKQAGQWYDFPAESGAAFDTGWNTIPVPASVPLEERVYEGVRLTFSGGAGSSAEVREFLFSGSPVGGRTIPAKIFITYPDAGQFYGRQAHIQGFVEPWNNGSGNATITLGVQNIPNVSGTIANIRTKDSVGLGAQADSDPWSLEVKAVYPNGETVTRTIELTQQMSAASPLTGPLAGTLSSAVGPKTKKTISHDESKLVVEAGTVSADTTITVTPLAEESVPALDVGMVNVTKGPRRGYRFLPHGAKFLKNVAVTLPYDRALIPPGHTEDDVRTYFFDEQAGRWVALPFVSVDKASKLLNSTTDHFTDMINAVVTVPDHPQAVSFNPTSMKDIKAADPGAQVNLIEPPKATNQGDARLSYPIEVPPGRQGLQPQLAVQYSSSGGNGWMGMGWDIPMQALTVDTRFGVPRYDAGLETETYMLSGEMLTPVAHRGELVARSADKVFRTRVEGQFRRIIRRGDHPSNYSWEVTDKNGVKYLYGATDPASETLADEFGHRFLWALCEIRDPNGNFVKFRYAKVNDPGVGSVPGSNIYLSRVTYTGHGTTEGLYAVSFIRDRDLNEPRRADVQIDARGAFKRVTADLLRKVEVSFAGAPVRSYEFRYNENPFGDSRPALAFSKTLLTSVSQFGTDGALFNKHTLTYYDEARDTAGNYRGFAGSTNWDMPGDGIGIGLMGRGTASALGGSQSVSAGGHLYVGVGVCCDVSSKEQTGGVKVGFSRSQSETLIAMADVDGDGLPDKVFKGNGFFFRKNLSGPNGTPRFDDPFPLDGLTAISRERVTSTTVGGEIYFGLPVMLDFNRATTTADAYLTDVNGDGLTDLVSGGQVVFGFLNPAGKPVFGANSADTPVPIGGGAIITDNLLESAAAIEAENAANFPLLDTLRRWVAPYDGVVSINAPVRLIEDPSPERAQSTAADGVRVAIQLEGSELWSETIAKDDYTTKTPTGVNAVPVLKGQRLYFRVQSVFNGEFDQVAWDPEISYAGVDTARTDVNDLAEYRYLASADFTLAGRSASVTLPATGTLRLAGTFEKTGVTTDDVRLVITRNGMEVFSQNVGFADTASVTLAQDLAVTKLDVLEWRILVDSPIDAARVRFTPAAHYTAAEGVDTVTDEQGNFLLQVNPPYDMDLYPANALGAPQGFFTVPTPATTPLPVQARLRFDGLASGETKQAVFTVKRRGVLLLKRSILLTGTGAPSDTATVAADVNVSAGEQLFFDVSSRDALFGAKLALLEARVGQDSDGDGLLDTLVPSVLHTRALDGLFAQPYRGWGAAGYNGNSPRDATPINQSLLVLNEHTTAENTRAYLYFPRPALTLWGGVDELAWVKAGSASASRLGLDDIRVARSEQFAGASAPARISRSENTSVSAGVTASTGFSESKLDFQDLNGDRFPDIVSASGGVQFSRAVGGLENQRRGAAGPARRSENFTAGASTDGAGNIARAIAAARGQVAGDGTKSGQGAQQGMDMPSLGFSANIGTGTADTEHDLIDVNGDGLPDKVFRSGDVELNLGYRFTGVREGWNGGIVNDGRSLDAGGGVNLGFNRAFYSMAGGLSLSVGMTKSDETYADINGDGLPDKIRLGSPFAVRLNTGSGFVPVAWPGGHDQVSMDKHVSLGGGGYVTFGISIPLVGIKIVFNPGVNLSTNMGRPEVAFRDMDGDGFADHVFSERDSQLRVALNPIGRTNLLKKVVRPMGATIDVEYTRDGNTFDLPQSRWNMTRVVVFDGHAGEGADTSVTTFRYSAPKYNRLEREFYGYASVAEEHRDTQNFGSLYRAITREYLTDSYYTKGLQRRELLQDHLGNPFTEVEQTYVVRDEGTGQPLANLISTTATAFPQLSRTDRRFYEGQASPGKTTFTTHTYDAFGNVETFTDAGELALATDDVFATIRHTNCQPAYIIVPDRIEVRGNGTVMRLREQDVDCATGDVREVRQYLADLSAAVTNLTYFPNGNLQTVTGPSNRNGQRYQLAYEYDPQVATHVARITDSHGLSSQASYNLLFGKVESTLDTNNNQTTNFYDTVGRISQIVGPYEQGQSTPTFAFQYKPDAAVPHAITRHVDKDADGNYKSSGTIDTILFTDALKRVIQTKKDSTVLETGAVPQDRMIVSGQITFDAFGRLIAQRYPTTEQKTSEVANGMFNAVADSEPPTTTQYDVLDRATRTTMPDATFTTMRYGFGADHGGQTQFETVAADANVNAGLRGAVKHTYRDVKELITAVKELNNAQAVWTSYGYDALKQIVQVVDDKLNTTSITHDNLGRRTAVDNPDAGRTETQYDLAGNVAKKITANLRLQAKSIDYDYDFNRLTAITYPNFPGNNVTYTYGAPGAAFNSAGRVTRITSQMGVEERQFGKLGETVYEKKTVTTFTNPQHPQLYETRYHFETFGRLLRITYPDLEVVTNVYDSGGNLQSASGVKAVAASGQNHRYNYLQKLFYDKFEQRAFVEQGNGVKTAYVYDARTRRLSGLTATRQGNALFQNLAYAYDKVGNVTRLQNVVEVPPPNVFGGPTNQSFVYDDLYRLTHADGTFQYSPNKTHAYSLDLTYDSIHNIQRKNQLHQIVQPSSTAITQKKTSYDFAYAYAASGPASVRPHAPTHIGVRTFGYDANGNQTGWTHDQNGTRRTIVWDDENRIQSLFDNGHEKTYKYDDQGQRLIKRGPQGETVYVNQFFTDRPGATGTKHVYAGKTRIASKLMRQDAPNANPAGKTPFEKDLYFYHPDHIGTSNFITDLNGKLYEHLEFFPFGESWVEENSNVQRTPYLFTAKELDEETGLYYFGARYYDPRTTIWQSADPILAKYLPDDESSASLPGIGGIYNPRNLGLYSYGHLNPVIYGDPDGNFVKLLVTVGKIAIKGGDLYGTVSGIIDNAKVIMDPNASVAEKLLAAGDIALDLGTGINTRDIKAAAKAVDKAADKIQALRQTQKAAEKTDDARKAVGARNPKVAESLRKGQKAHKEREYGEGFEKEVELPSGKRMDAYNKDKKEVVELKPDNPRAIKKGEKQVKEYCDECDRVHGPGHKGRVETYNPKDIE